MTAKQKLKDMQENNLSYPWVLMKGHWKFLGEGVFKVKILETKYEAKLEFPGGQGVQNKTTFHRGSMDIFWNCTIPKLKGCLEKNPK